MQEFRVSLSGMNDKIEFLKVTNQLMDIEVDVLYGDKEGDGKSQMYVINLPDIVPLRIRVYTINPEIQELFDPWLVED